MSVSFPNCNSVSIPDESFLAAWQTFFDRFGPPGSNAAVDAMPVGSVKENLDVLLRGWRRFSLDTLCRLLVECRNTMQASPGFRQVNQHLLARSGPQSGRECVRLTAAARRSLGSLDARHLAEADAVFEADQEDGADGVLGEPTTEFLQQPARSGAPTVGLTTVAGVVSALVCWLEQDPFVPAYRGKPLTGSACLGWTSRLAGYFWPRPGIGLAANHAVLNPLLVNAGRLRHTLARTWTPAEEASAVSFARGVFAWGGVPQRHVTARQVREVFESAVQGVRVGGAPMNSGWTKVAALASAGLNQELAIWDSRVAHSLIGRLDILLSSPGLQRLRGAAPLAGIGFIPGRGGTRTSGLPYLGRWRNGYRRWDVQFSGGELVRLIRDELNRQHRSGQIRGPLRSWSTRDVEMVLFMDGY